MKEGITVGLDMGDKKHDICILDTEGEITKRSSVSNTAIGIRKYFSKLPPCLVAMEAGTHSRWVSNILEELGHEVLVGNPRKLRMIWDSENKNDQRDAEMLARVARFDRNLLYPIHHRGNDTQADLAIIKSRDMLVKTRVTLVTHARGLVKSFGMRIKSCSAASFHKHLDEEMPDELRLALEPILDSIIKITEQIQICDYKLESVSFFVVFASIPLR